MDLISQNAVIPFYLSLSQDIAEFVWKSRNDVELFKLFLGSNRGRSFIFVGANVANAQ
jgi:hypothetical protein